MTDFGTKPTLALSPHAAARIADIHNKLGSASPKHWAAYYKAGLKR